MAYTLGTLEKTFNNALEEGRDSTAFPGAGQYVDWHWDITKGRGFRNISDERDVCPSNFALKNRRVLMPRGDKSSYARATVNKETGGREKSGSGRGKKRSYASSRKGGRLGGRACAARPAAARSRSARKAAATRKRRKSK